MKKTLLLSLSLSLSRFCSTLKTTAFTQAQAIRSVKPLKW